MGECLIDGIKNWLRDQGYPLEMQAASAFRKAGFEVTQSNLYTDLETGKSREIDVYAVHRDYVGITKIAFLVECKSSKKPWVLLSDPEVLAGHNRIRSFAIVNQTAIRAMSERPVFDSLTAECPWFKKEGLTGYSLRAAFSEKDIAYDAASGVAKACFAFVNRAKKYYQTIAFPVIVISSPLIRCSLDEAGEIQAEEISEGEVFHKHDLENPWSCIRVVTLPALPNFVRQAQEVSSLLRARLMDSEVKLWEAEFSTPHPRFDGASDGDAGAEDAQGPPMEEA